MAMAMAMAKGYLATVGIAYLLLAVWCALFAAKTSQAIGIELTSGSAQSEYFSIYGGLQLALGILFLLPLVKGSSVDSALVTCVVVHGCLVLFRSTSLFLYEDIRSVTYVLAVIEWCIFLSAATVMWRHSSYN